MPRRRSMQVHVTVYLVARVLWPRSLDASCGWLVLAELPSRLFLFGLRRLSRSPSDGAASSCPSGTPATLSRRRSTSFVLVTLGRRSRGAAAAASATLEEPLSCPARRRREFAPSPGSTCCVGRIQHARVLLASFGSLWGRQT
eukprot:scaffold2739_cov257-Pinguiococcus_pyrenoidosus.AAC.13